MPQYHLDCDHGNKPIRVEHFFQASVPKAALIHDRSERPQTGMVLWVLSTIDRQGRVNVAAKTAVIKISLGIVEIALQKLLVCSFQNDIEPKVLPIQLH